MSLRPTTLPRRTPWLPMPNDHLNGGTVIASVWLDDEPGCEQALTLILQRSAPFYTMAEWTVNNGGDWVLTHETSHENIVPAVEDYEQSGGDY